MRLRVAGFKTAGALGGVIGYGCLAAFLYLVGLQTYRWFREGEWTHIGVSDGLRVALLHCCVRGEETGRLAGFMNWLSAPADWLGLHRVIEVVPASLALFAMSIAGNCLLLYCRDRLDRR